MSPATPVYFALLCHCCIRWRSIAENNPFFDAYDSSCTTTCSPSSLCTPHFCHFWSFSVPLGTEDCKELASAWLWTHFWQQRFKVGFIFLVLLPLKIVQLIALVCFPAVSWGVLKQDKAGVLWDDEGMPSRSYGRTPRQHSLLQVYQRSVRGGCFRVYRDVGTDLGVYLFEVQACFLES